MLNKITSTFNKFAEKKLSEKLTITAATTALSSATAGITIASCGTPKLGLTIFVCGLGAGLSQALIAAILGQREFHKALDQEDQSKSKVAQANFDQF